MAPGADDPPDAPGGAPGDDPPGPAAPPEAAGGDGGAGDAAVVDAAVADAAVADAAAADAPGPELVDAPPPPPPRPSWLRTIALVAIGAALASVAFWLARPRPRAAEPSAAAPSDAGFGPKAPRQPSLPPPQKGPGDRRLVGTVVDGAGAGVGGAHVTVELERGEGGAAAPRGPAAGRDGGAAAITRDGGAAVIDAAPAAPPDAALVMPAVVAVTDGHGAFALDGLVPGRYRLRVEGPDVFTGELRYVPVPSDEVRVVVARRVRITGRVVDGGAAVRGAQVHLVGDAVAGLYTATTGADGGFDFPDLPEGSYQVWATDGDLAARAQRALRLGAGPFAPLELRLESAAIVVGRVVAQGGGAPIVAEVALRPATAGLPGALEEEPARFARTDADGAFRIEGVPHGRWAAEAYAPGWIATGSLEFDAGKSPLTLELAAGAMIEGVVVDGAGRPVEGAAVSAAAAPAGGAAAPVGPAAIASADTDDDRLRAFAGLLGAAPSSASAAGGPRAAPETDPRFVPRGELGVLLGPIPLVPPPGTGAARRAAIVDALPPAGAPPAGGQVASIGVAAPPPAPLPVDPARAPIWLTGADGRFRIPGLAGGAWTVIARAPAYAEGRSRAVPLAPGDVATVTVALSPGVFVVGTIRDQRGEPIDGATITVEPAGGRGPGAGGEPLSAISADGGAYRVGPVVGAVHVRASAFGHADAERDLDLTAPADAPRDEPLDLVLVTADAAIEGELDDATGLPVARAQIVVRGKSDVAGRRATTDAAGRFRIGELPPGPLRLAIDAPGYPTQELDATTASDVKLVLALGGGLDGLVFDHHTGQPVAGAAITATGPAGAHQDAESGADGRFAIVPVAAGAWKLRVALPGYLAVARAVDVPVGDRPGAITARDLRVELERGATVAGLVRDRFGSRLPGAVVTIRRGGDDAATATARTDADGAFRIEDAPTGDVDVLVEQGALRGASRLTLRPGDELLSVQLEAQ